MRYLFNTKGAELGTYETASIIGLKRLITWEQYVLASTYCTDSNRVTQYPWNDCMDIAEVLRHTVRQSNLEHCPPYDSVRSSAPDCALAACPDPITLYPVVAWRILPDTALKSCCQSILMRQISSLEQRSPGPGNL